MTTTVYPGLTRSGDDRPALRLRRHFTTPGVSPYDAISWEMRTAAISDESGKVFFEQTGIEIPDFWSQTATQVVASKYFRGRIGTPERESSARQMVDRIVNVIAAWGRLPACGHGDSQTSKLANLQGDSSAASLPVCPVCQSVPYFASEDEALTF